MFIFVSWPIPFLIYFCCTFHLLDGRISTLELAYRLYRGTSVNSHYIALYNAEYEEKNKRKIPTLSLAHVSLFIHRLPLETTRV